jgi:hypothetical protein
MQKHPQSDEIAGLVERVGNPDSGKPFSTYEGLVDVIRDGLKTGPSEQAALDDGSNSNIHKVRTFRR